MKSPTTETFVIMARSSAVHRVRGFLRGAWSTVFDRMDNQFEREFQLLFRERAESVLDVGCGFASPLKRLARRPSELVGVDGHLPAIQANVHPDAHDRYVCASLFELEDHFEPKSFDTVVALDVIEHLEKLDAMRLINSLERIARQRVILYTPNGFLPQGEEFGNPYQRHLSGWGSSEMELRGYAVVGVEGLRPLRGYMARIRWKPYRFWLTVSLLTQPLVRRFPRFAFRLLCVKSFR